MDLEKIPIFLSGGTGTFQFWKRRMMAGSTTLPYVDKEDRWSSHGTIARWLRDLPQKSVILDIGCASGTIGRACNGLGFIRKGIEPNAAWAEMARPFYEEISVRPVDAVQDDFIRGADAVVCADVLEHLIDPAAVLSRVVGLQRPGCLFILSVPNIANLWVRLNLLLGRFEYTERGIMDRTHFRFFTRRSLLQMIAACSLEVKQLTSTSIPLDLVHPFFKDNPIGRSFHHFLGAITRLFPTLLGYQFVVMAGKKK
jgi:2-polyprenyl-3-methyl-5-hydroxy-6-metoxy-1,4-benzoquinol methylase